MRFITFYQLPTAVRVYLFSAKVRIEFQLKKSEKLLTLEIDYTTNDPARSFLDIFRSLFLNVITTISTIVTVSRNGFHFVNSSATV